MRADIQRDISESLSRPQRELSPKYFYDQRGSELFEAITRLPEYYPTRTEAALLQSFGAPWLRSVGARALIELGAGNAEKTRILLNAMATDVTYIPVDISASFLEETAQDLERSYPSLHVQPLVSDITRIVGLPETLPAPAVFAFLGSTIGNFDNDSAIRLLRNVRRGMRSGDYFLMGVDLRKDPALLNSAYNDARGITAEFNLNILQALNDAAGTDFDASSFEHRAYYDETHHRIEMHLVSRRDQVIHIPDQPDVDIRAGETIRTEISTKYDEATVRFLFSESSLMIDEWRTDEQSWYALVTARPS